MSYAGLDPEVRQMLSMEDQYWITINYTTKTMIVPEYYQVLGVQGDSGTRSLYVKFEATPDLADLAAFDVKAIMQTPGGYNVEKGSDAKVQSEGAVLCRFDVPEAACVEAGTLRVGLCASIVKSEGTELEWHIAPYNFTIAEFVPEGVAYTGRTAVVEVDENDEIVNDELAILKVSVDGSTTQTAARYLKTPDGSKYPNVQAVASLVGNVSGVPDALAVSGSRLYLSQDGTPIPGSDVALAELLPDVSTGKYVTDIGTVGESDEYLEFIYNDGSTSGHIYAFNKDTAGGSLFMSKLASKIPAGTITTSMLSAALQAQITSGSGTGAEPVRISAARMPQNNLSVSVTYSDNSSKDMEVASGAIKTILTGEVSQDLFASGSIHRAKLHADCTPKALYPYDGDLYMDFEEAGFSKLTLEPGFLNAIIKSGDITTSMLSDGAVTRAKMDTALIQALDMPTWSVFECNSDGNKVLNGTEVSYNDAPFEGGLTELAVGKNQIHRDAIVKITCGSAPDMLMPFTAPSAGGEFVVRIGKQANGKIWAEFEGDVRTDLETFVFCPSTGDSWSATIIYR